VKNAIAFKLSVIAFTSLAALAGACSSGDEPGGGGNGGSGGTAMAPPGTTKVANCAKYPTLAAMDDFFLTRCADNVACHATVVYSDFKMPEVWRRMFNKNAYASCKKTKMLDPTDYRKSMFLAKQQAPVTCPITNGDQDLPGDTMPPPPAKQLRPDKVAALTAEELTCLENFVKAATGN
jgi:hypothetical protein